MTCFYNNWVTTYGKSKTVPQNTVVILLRCASVTPFLSLKRGRRPVKSPQRSIKERQISTGQGLVSNDDDAAMVEDVSQKRTGNLYLIEGIHGTGHIKSSSAFGRTPLSKLNTAVAVGRPIRRAFTGTVLL